MKSPSLKSDKMAPEGARNWGRLCEHMPSNNTDICAKLFVDSVGVMRSSRTVDLWPA